MDWTLEVVLLPVSDIDRSVRFYRDQVGFDLDHDTIQFHAFARDLESLRRVGQKTLDDRLDFTANHAFVRSRKTSIC